MKRFWENCKVWACCTVITLLAAGFIGGMVWLSFKVWRIGHPGAPWWAFLLHN